MGLDMTGLVSISCQISLKEHVYYTITCLSFPKESTFFKTLAVFSKLIYDTDF